MKSLFLTRDQALNLLSGSIDSKALDYQRTNPREYQIVRTHSKQTSITQPPVAPCAGCLIQTTNKTKIQTQSSADRITTSLSLAHQRGKKKLSTTLTLYEAYTNHWTNLQFSSVQFTCSVVSDSLRPHESQHAIPPCPSPTLGVRPDSRPSSQ